MPKHAHENEFSLHVNEISFSYERMGTKTRLENDAKGIQKWLVETIIKKGYMPFALKEIILVLALVISLYRSNPIPGIRKWFILCSDVEALQRSVCLIS